MRHIHRRCALHTLVALCSAMLSFAATAQTDDEEVRAFSERYARLVLAHDFKAAAALAHEGAVRRAGGVDALGATMRASARLDAELGAQAVDDQLGPVRRFAHGGSTVFIVEATRFIPSFPVPIEVDHLYVVSRNRTTEQLEMLDLGCVSVDWIAEIEPAFRGSALAAELVHRDLLGPAAASN